MASILPFLYFLFRTLVYHFPLAQQGHLSSDQDIDVTDSVGKVIVVDLNTNYISERIILDEGNALVTDASVFLEPV